MQNNHSSVQHLLHKTAAKKKILKAFTDWGIHWAILQSLRQSRTLVRLQKDLRETAAWNWSTRSAWEVSASLMGHIGQNLFQQFQLGKVEMLQISLS